jgi:hypothetical protein
VAAGRHEKVLAMQRARRAALGAALALLGALAMTGCRSEPSVAAYVGSVAYTHADVDRIVNPATARENPAVSVSPQWVVRLIVTRDLAKKLAAEKKLTVETPDLSPLLNMPATDEYAKLWSEVVALENALGESAPPATITDEDLVRFYHAGVAAGFFRPDVPMGVLRGSAGPELAPLFGLRKMFADAAVKHHVSVNPRFAPLAMPLLVRGNGGRLFQLVVPFPPDSSTGVRDSG